jgi:hypothetical protein
VYPSTMISKRFFAGLSCTSVMAAPDGSLLQYCQEWRGHAV